MADFKQVKTRTRNISADKFSSPKSGNVSQMLTWLQSQLQYNINIAPIKLILKHKAHKVINPQEKATD